jgi:hypothetical protein
VKPLFEAGQKLRHKNHPQLGRYAVLQDPRTCIHNDKPSYLLKIISSAVDISPFHQLQQDVEKHWEEIPQETIFPTKVLFPISTHVRHVKTGGVYEILITPDKGKLEATGEPAYSYSDGGTVWHRRQVEMEDGRFEAHHLPSHPINH